MCVAPSTQFIGPATSRCYPNDIALLDWYRAVHYYNRGYHQCYWAACIGVAPPRLFTPLLDNALMQQGQLSWPPHHLFYAGLFLCCHLNTTVYHLPCNALLSYVWVVALIFLCSLCFYYRMTETMSEQESDGPQEDLNCGFCLQKLPYMTEPTQQLCSHVFCLPCIQEDPKRDCPICGWVRGSVGTCIGYHIHFNYTNHSL